jgi:hypothetical protein
MEQMFQMGYMECHKDFYFFPANWKGKKDTIDEHEQAWNVH